MCIIFLIIQRPVVNYSLFNCLTPRRLVSIGNTYGLHGLHISVHKGQGRRSLLDARGLQALRRHCITHQHDSVINITKRAQEYFQKPLSVNSTRRAICRCQLKLYHAKRKPYVNMVQKRRQAHYKFTISKWKSVLWSDDSKFDILVGNHGRCVLRLKRRETLGVISIQFKSQHL